MCDFGTNCETIVFSFAARLNPVNSQRIIFIYSDCGSDLLRKFVPYGRRARADWNAPYAIGYLYNDSSKPTIFSVTELSLIDRK